MHALAEVVHRRAGERHPVLPADQRADLAPFGPGERPALSRRPRIQTSRSPCVGTSLRWSSTGRPGRKVIWLLQRLRRTRSCAPMLMTTPLSSASSCKGSSRSSSATTACSSRIAVQRLGAGVVPQGRARCLRRATMGSRRGRSRRTRRALPRPPPLRVPNEPPCRSRRPMASGMGAACTMATGSLVIIGQG